MHSPEPKREERASPHCPLSIQSSTIDRILLFGTLENFTARLNSRLLNHTIWWPFLKSETTTPVRHSVEQPQYPQNVACVNKDSATISRALFNRQLLKKRKKEEKLFIMKGFLKHCQGQRGSLLETTVVSVSLEKDLSVY